MHAALNLVRPRQWPKNLVVFGALFFGGQFLHVDALVRTGVVFVVFCLVSSATYIFNDWRDRGADRQHPLKRDRPIAAGTIDVSAALLLMAALYGAAVAIGLGAGFGPTLWGLLAAYVAINVAYSLGLKHVPVVELFCVASGFVLRFFAGAAAIHVQPSPWIIAAVAMGALLIVCAKRRADIAAGNDPDRVRRSLGGYNLPFLDSVVTGLTSGTLVVYLLFCVSDYAESRYGQRIMLTAIPVAMGLFRFQQIVFVEGRGDAPAELIFRDTFLLLASACVLLMFAAFLYI
jgi:4-hydroxybenzoate polyprenyltransferase